MRFRGLDLNLLVALDSLLMHRNVTRTANGLHLTQSAMSGALGRLRRHFNDDLLVQVGRRMVLTPLAVQLEKPLRDILLQAETLVSARVTFTPALTDRRFTVVSSDYVISVLMSGVVRRVAEAAPNASVSLQEIGLDTVQQFKRGEIELLLNLEPYLSDEYPRESLFEEKYRCIVWSKNKLVGETLSLQEYLSSHHVVRTLSSRPTFDESFLARLGHVRKIAAEAPSFTLLPYLLIGTNHIATVYSRLARLYAKQLPLRIVQPPLDFPSFALQMQWHHHQATDPASLWFRALVREEAAKIANPSRSPGPS